MSGEEVHSCFGTVWNNWAGQSVLLVTYVKRETPDSDVNSDLV